MRHGPSPHMVDPDDESLDLAATKEMLVLFARAPLRRPKLSAAIFLCVAALGALASLKVSPSYEAQAAIVVQKNATMPTFGDAAKNQQNNDYDPAVGVSEAVKGRDNLMALVRETHLLERTPPPVNGAVMPEQERVLGLSKALDKKLKVTSDGSLVSFSAEWSDPQTSYEIVSAAVRHFLDARTAAEVAIVSDTITLLEEHASNERDGIDVAMQEFLRMKEGWKGPSSASASASVAAPVAAARPTSPAIAPNVARQAELAKRLEETKQQMKEMQEDRRRQLSELKSQLAGALATYTPSHPTAMGLQRKIEALSDEPSSLAALKNEERTMLNELASMTGTKATGGGPVSLGALTGGIRSTAPASKQDLEIVDPASAMALSKLQSRIHKYEEFMDQISAAKLELDLAKNAFKYRYSVYKPAEVPTHPKYPVHAMLIGGGTLLGAVLAAIVAALLDLFSGRFVEPWQVKRRLSLPLLGEVSRP